MRIYRTLSSFSLLLPLLIQLGCGEQAPDDPTWFSDVQPILNANCVRCHGTPARPGTPSSFRLDRFVKNKDDGAVLDAYDMVERIVARTSSSSSPMPPDASLSEVQIETLAKWLALGLPKGITDNQLPRAEILKTVPSEIDQTLDLRFRAFDPDNDGLIIKIGYRLAGSKDKPTILNRFVKSSPFDADPWLIRHGSLIEGIADTAQIKDNLRYDIVAVMDDGFSDTPSENQNVVLLAPNVQVSHKEKGTAPSVSIPTSNNQATICWSASDPDLQDELRVDIDLVRLDASLKEESIESLHTNRMNVSNDGSEQCEDWTTIDDTPSKEDNKAIQYRFRVSVKDKVGNIRSAISDIFTISTTKLTWANDIKPILITFCGNCHGEPNANGAPSGFRLDKYNTSDMEEPASNDIGAFEKQDRILQRMIFSKTMPPSSQPQPSKDELDKVEEWIKAGSPL